VASFSPDGPFRSRSWWGDLLDFLRYLFRRTG